MAGIGKVSAIFTASSAGLSAGVSKASSSLKGLQKDVASLRSGMQLLNAISGAQLLGSVASTAMSYARSLVNVGQAQAEAIDSTSKLSARLGMTYSELAGLAHAGDLAGVSMDTIGAAATKADVAFVKAAQGSKTAQAGFAAIGLELGDLQGLSSAERFSEIADAIAGLPTEAERAAAAVKLFGRSGAELLPLFAGGAGSIQEATEEAQRFGMALTGAQGRDVEEMNDSFSKVSAAIGGIVKQITAYLAPSITSIATTFTDFVGSMGGGNIGQAIGEGIIAGARYMAGVGDAIISGLSAVWEFAGGIGAVWGTVTDLIGRAASYMAGVGRGLAAVFTGNAAVVLRVVGVISDTAREMSYSLAEASRANFIAAGENFANLFGAGKGGSGGAGPLSVGLDIALAKARLAAGQLDEANKTTIAGAGGVGGGGGAVAAGVAAGITAANRELRAVDSRSKEGIAEMFRLMRGETEDAAERTARATERIADNTEDMGVDIEELSFAG
jgi:hypothetical protein